VPVIPMRPASPHATPKTTNDNSCSRSAWGLFQFSGPLLLTGLYADPTDGDAFIKRQTVAACERVSDPLCNRAIECVAGQLRVLLELSYDAVLGWMRLIAEEEFRC
jgi:hypothetical protein